MLNDKPTIAILAMVKDNITQCGNCVHWNRRSCPELRRDMKKQAFFWAKKQGAICDGQFFEPIHKQQHKEGAKGGRGGKRDKKTYKLDLTAEIPDQLQPCGFTGDILTETAWLPYRDKDETLELRPSIIIVEKGKNPEILDFLKQERIKGTFPSKDLDSLMTVKAAKMIAENTIIDPHEVDREIEEAIKKHLDMPKAERILCKRWIEGTFFFDCFEAFPLQNILGVSESGKSRLCLLNLSLCYHAEQSINVTEAGIFRSKEEDKVTLIIDEAEYLNNPKLYATLRILLNASYSKNSGYVS